MFFPLETVYVLNNELCYSKIVISCETLCLFLAKAESKYRESFLEDFLFSGQSQRSFTRCIRTELQGKLRFPFSVLIEHMGKGEGPSVNSLGMTVQVCHCSVQERTKRIYPSGLLVKQLWFQNFFWRSQRSIQNVLPIGLPPFI